MQKQLRREGRHPLQSGVDRGSAVADGSSNPDVGDETIRAPVEQLAGLDPQIRRHFLLGHEGFMTTVFGCVHVHASGCMSTRLVSEDFKQPARLET